jgi:hypothetical protein
MRALEAKFNGFSDYRFYLGYACVGSKPYPEQVTDVMNGDRFQPGPL